MRLPESRATTAAKGGAVLVGAQALIIITQFGYSSVAARLLPPADFGAFAVAFSLLGLLTLLLASGLPSYVLQLHRLAPGEVWSVRCMAWFGGLVGATAMVLGANLWASVMQSPSVAPVTRALAIQMAIAPASVLELALLRREGRRGWDASVQVLAATAGVLVGLVAVYVRGSAVSLVVAPIVAACVTLLLATAVRRDRHPRSRPSTLRDAYSFARKVTTQNLGFFIIGACPTWVVSGATNPQLMGQYSRASLITGMPSTGLSTAMNRTLQPEWRHLQGNRSRAMVDACVIAAGVAFPLFALLSAVSFPLVLLWLGSGWEAAAGMTRILAVAFGLQVVFTVLANAAEMQGMFKPVRRTQLVMAACLLPGLVQLGFTGSILVLLWALAFSQLMGILCLAFFLGEEAPGVFRLLVPQLVVTMAYSVAAWVIATVGVRVVAVSGLGGESIIAPMSELVAGCGLALGVLLLTLRWQPAWRLARERGIIAGFLSKTN